MNVNSNRAFTLLELLAVIVILAIIALIATPIILNIINKHYNTNFKEFDNIKIKDNKYLGSFHEFVWPNLDNEYYSEDGSCYALRDHIGILSDGNIVPCCLDTKADIKLGNIFDDNLEEILTSNKAIKMKEGFKHQKKVEELCKHCSFLQ